MFGDFTEINFHRRAPATTASFSPGPGASPCAAHGRAEPDGGPGRGPRGRIRGFSAESTGAGGKHRALGAEDIGLGHTQVAGQAASRGHRLPPPRPHLHAVTRTPPPAPPGAWPSAQSGDPNMCGVTGGSPCFSGAVSGGGTPGGKWGGPCPYGGRGGISAGVSGKNLEAAGASPEPRLTGNRSPGTHRCSVAWGRGRDPGRVAAGTVVEGSCHPDSPRLGWKPSLGAPTRSCLDQGRAWLRPSCGGRAVVTLQFPLLPDPLPPWGGQELRHREVTHTPLGLQGCHRPTEFGKHLEKKEPSAQKPRLNKACGGRARRGAWGPDGAEGVGGSGSSVTGPASAPGGDSEGPFVPGTHVRGHL